MHLYWMVQLGSPLPQLSRKEGVGYAKGLALFFRFTGGRRLPFLKAKIWSLPWKKNPPFSEPILLIFGSVPCSIWKPYCSVSKETANKQGLWYLLCWKSQARPIAKALCSGSQKHLLSFQSWNIFFFLNLIFCSLPPPAPISTFVLGESCGGNEGRKGSSQLYKQSRVKTELCNL